MTAEAVKQSTFTQFPGTSGQIAKLGLIDPAMLRGPQYFDLGADAFMLSRNTTEDVFVRLRQPETGLTIPDTYSLSGWLIQGVIREDDNPVETPGSEVRDGLFRRVFGHFFDPQNNRGMVSNGLLGPRAVDWALLPNARVDLVRPNHFKVSDAREAMWRALTLTASDANGGFTGSPWPSNWPTATAESVRRAYWATTFRTLGDVVHLVQDMAQPQHTRNDTHSGLGCVINSCVGGHASFFELYLRARTRHDPNFSLDEGFLTDTDTPRNVSPDQLTYVGYPKPTFNTYADYFSTGLFVANGSGYGLANYSNRGFYSFGTNINSSAAVNDYPSPHPRGVGLTHVVVTGDAFQDMTRHKMPQGSLTLITGTVRDFAVPSQDASDVKLSSVGMWDQFLQARTGRRSHTLNYYNYDDQARLLVPRAVAYSAGLIDYFFRGQMEIGLPDSAVYAIVDHAAFAGAGAPATDAANGYKGFGKIRVKLKNITAPVIAPDGQTYAQTMGPGTLVAVAKFHRNLKYKDDLTGEKGGPAFDPTNFRSTAEEIVVSAFKTVSEVSSESAQDYEFTFGQEIPINATDLYLQVVFRGVLGQEADAVVVATQDLSEPTYVAFMNSADYFQYPDGHVALCTPAQSCGVSPLAGRWRFYRNGPPNDPPQDDDPPRPAGAFVVFESIGVGRFSRIAFLTNAQPGVQSIYNDFVSGSLPVPSSYATNISQRDFNANGSTTQWLTPFQIARGVYNLNLVPYITAGNGTISTTQTVDLEQLNTPLQDEHPVPFFCLRLEGSGCAQ